MMLISLIIVFAPKTYSHFVGPTVSVIVAGSASFAVVPLGAVIFG
jgi:hypothetical protein